MLYAAAAPSDKLREAVASWQGEPEELVVAAGLALAHRIAARDARWTWGPWLQPFDGTAAADWLRVVIGQPREGEPDVVAGGRACEMPDAELRRRLEVLLWRSGSHPRIAVHSCWNALVRDLLLTGSEYAAAQEARAQSGGERLYLPPGQQPGERRWFEPACEFFGWWVDPGANPWVPLDLRIP